MCSCFLLCQQWFAAGHIHHSVPGHKQVNCFANVLNLQGLAGVVPPEVRGGGGAAASIAPGNQIQELPTGVGHLLQIAIRSQSRFAPSHKQIYFGSCDYHSDVPAAKRRKRIPATPV
jgi:hypothetical protein